MNNLSNTPESNRSIKNKSDHSNMIENNEIKIEHEELVKVQEESDNGSYKPSVNELMDDLNDHIDTSAESNDYNSELEHLIEESKIPVDELKSKYSYEIDIRKRKARINDDTPKLKRYTNGDIESEKSDTSDHNSPLSDQRLIKLHYPRKTVPIGPTYQVNVPEFTRKDVSIDMKLAYADLDVLIYDCSIEEKISLKSFFTEINSKYSDIMNPDEDNFMEFYTKYKGDAMTALNDIEFIKKIIKAQNDPLTNFTDEECLSFKDAMLKHGKNFSLIQKFCYPNRTVKEVVNTYYVWKKSPLYDEYLLERLAIKKGHILSETTTIADDITSLDSISGGTKSNENSGISQTDQEQII